MDYPDIYDPQDLDRRQQMAVARRKREGARLTLLAQLIDAQRRADELRRWISIYTGPAGDHPHPELARMVAWAALQINDLERTLSPAHISEAIRERDLFPDADPLDDSKGELQRHHLWGHSTVLRHINAA